MKYIKTKEQGAQNFIPMSKVRYLWAINLIMLIAVVFLGIEQAGKGAMISNLENKIEEQVILKRSLSEDIFNNDSSLASIKNAESLGYIKPSKMYYFKTENIFARLPVQ